MCKLADFGPSVTSTFVPALQSTRPLIKAHPQPEYVLARPAVGEHAFFLKHETMVYKRSLFDFFRSSLFDLHGVSRVS